MAVEKLILRSILYGADKIPDSWFERLPGGYYKDAQGHTHKIKSGPEDKSGRKASKGDGERKATEDDFYPDRGRSERRRRSHKERSRSSYDGGDDEDDYYYYRGDGRPHRSLSRPRQRPRSLEDDRRRDDGYTRERRDHRDRRRRSEYHNGSRGSGDYCYPLAPGYDRRRSAAFLNRPPTTSERRSDDFVATTRAARVAAEPVFAEPRRPPQPPVQEPLKPALKGGISNGYVPYAHIYGNGRQQTSPPFSDPFVDRHADTSSAPAHAQSTFRPQRPPPLNPNSEFAYHSQRGVPPRNSLSASGYDPRQAPRHDENGQIYPASLPTSASASIQGYSPRSDSYESVDREVRPIFEREVFMSAPRNAQPPIHKPNYRRHGTDRNLSPYEESEGREGRRDRRRAGGSRSEGYWKYP